MIQVVQASCPSCKKVLRIPNDWLGQPVRCKHCRQMFQGRRKKAGPIPAVPDTAGFLDDIPISVRPAASTPLPAPAAPVRADERIMAAPPAQPVPAPVLKPPQAAPAAEAITAQPVLATPAAAAPAPYGYNPYAPYTPAFDFDAQAAVAPVAADPTGAAPAPAKKPKNKNHWWKPAALGGVALFIMIGVLIASGGNMSGLFSKKKAPEAGPSTLSAKAKTPEPKTVTPPPKANPNTETDNTPKEPPKTNPKTTQPKIDNPKKETGTPKIEPKEPKVEPKSVPEVRTYMPRRALLISVHNYLFANSLHYGTPFTDRPAYPGSSTGVLSRQMTMPPFLMPGTQVIELSDGDYEHVGFGLDPDMRKYSRPTHTTVKSVIETTVVEFLRNTRAQDRIVVSFAGHAVEVDNDVYLAPLEADLQDAKTLIPLSWLYDQMIKCNARQRLLILDVCRFSPSRGLELPDGGPMGEMLDAKLQNPPPGLQVWSSCSKEQQSFEFEKGSLFLQALCASVQQRFPGIAKNEDPFPLDELVTRVNQYMKAQLDPQKLTQISRLSGTAPADGMSYDPNLALPAQQVLRPPVLPTGGQVAGAALIEGILDEIGGIPPVRAANRKAQKTMLKSEYLPPFPSKSMDLFKGDMTFMAAEKADPAVYPLRVAIMEAIKVLNENANFSMRETLTNAGGPIAPKVKEEFLKAQEDPGIAVFMLERALKKLEDAGKERDKEMSKRWQAHFDYTMARLLSRTVYTYEYNFMLAQVRSDSLPALEPAVHNGWRIGSRDKIQIREDKVRNYTRTIRSIWDRIKEEYPETPWAMLARRESLIALGLEWRPSRD